MAKEIIKEVRKKKLPVKLMAMFLIMALTISNCFSLGIFLLSGTKVLAISNEELENQGIATNNKNVEFDAYYISETGEKVHSTSNKFNETEELHIELNVKNGGYLKNGKIEIQETNFNIIGNLENVSTVESINNEGKEINLKRIETDKNVIYDLPIEKEKGETYNINNLNKNNKIKLTGTYIDNNAEETAIEKEITINTEWHSEIEIEIAQDLTKYVPFTTAENKGIIIQTEIKIDKKEKETSLPIKSTELTITAPTLKETAPEEVKITTKGTEQTNGQTIENVNFGEQNYTYNKETREIKITVENTPDQNGNIWSGLTGTDQYIVTYIYPEESYDNITIGEELTIENKITGKLQAYNSPNKENPKTSEKENTKQYTLTNQIGEIIGYEVTSINEKINKGYMYTNLENGNKNQTQYTINWTANIGYIDGQELTMKSTEPSNNNAEKLYDNTNYQKTEIQKETFDRILGEEGYIEIYQETTLIGKIDKNTTPDQNNTLKAEYQNTNNITIKTSAPKEIGILQIKNTKTLETNKTLEEIKGYKVVLNTLNNKESETQLEEPTTKITMETNKNRISAINTNENVEIKITLQRNEQKYNLYKNPVIYLEFPSYVANLNVKDIQIAYADGLERNQTETKLRDNEKGNKEIVIKLEGNQTEYSSQNITGTQIIINTDIIVKENTPTINAEIKGYIHNEKGTGYETIDQERTQINNQTVGYTSKTLDFIAPTGIIASGKITNYNNTNEEAQARNNRKNRSIRRKENSANGTNNTKQQWSRM